VEMRGLGRISVRSGHAQGLAEIEFRWMQILEEDFGRIRRFDKFEGTSHVGMRGLGRISVRSGHAQGLAEIEFRWMQILEEDFGRIRRFDKFEET
jgi:hypothetical protein